MLETGKDRDDADGLAIERWHANEVAAMGLKLGERAAWRKTEPEAERRAGCEVLHLLSPFPMPWNDIELVLLVGLADRLRILWNHAPVLSA